MSDKTAQKIRRSESGAFPSVLRETERLPLARYLSWRTQRPPSPDGVLAEAGNFPYTSEMFNLREGMGMGMERCKLPGVQMAVGG